MGGSKSKSKTSATNTYDTTVVTNNDLELLNKSVNDFVSNTVVNQASNCSASITQLQNVNISDINSSGSVVIGGVDQNQSSAITFDCVQLSAFQNDIANGVLTQYMSAIENNYDTSSLAQMDATAESNSKNQFGSTGSSNSKSSTDNTYKFNSVTNTNQNIQNIVENSITNNMSLSDVQSCMASVTSSQSVNIARINAGGDVTIQPISQTQASSLLASCLQEKNNGNKISNQIATDLGLTVVTESTVTSSAEMASKATAESSNTGVFQSMGEGFSTAIGGILGAFGFGDPTISMYCLIALIVIAVVGTLGGIGYYSMQMGGSPLENGNCNSLKIILAIMLFIVVIKLCEY